MLAPGPKLTPCRCFLAQRRNVKAPTGSQHRVTLSRESTTDASYQSQRGHVSAAVRTAHMFVRHISAAQAYRPSAALRITAAIRAHPRRPRFCRRVISVASNEPAYAMAAWSRHARSLAVQADRRGGHVHDRVAVAAPERQIRSDEGVVGASVVMDVAPENRFTTSRHAERSDIVDTEILLLRIGDLGRFFAIAEARYHALRDRPFSTVRGGRAAVLTARDQARNRRERRCPGAAPALVRSIPGLRPEILAAVSRDRRHHRSSLVRECAACHTCGIG
jgi:hypothetical protein